MHLRSAFFTALAFFLLALALARPSSAQDVWQPRTSGVTVPLWSVAYAAGQWVAVGEQGTILTSPDGAAWTPRVSGFSARWLVGVGYGTPGDNGLWVVVGESGLILTSPDAITWTARRATGTRINAVAWGNGTFVAADDAGSTYYSVDGVTWVGPAFGRTTFTRGLVYGAPHFVTTGLAQIQTTFDGSSSVTRASAPQLQGAAYGRRLYLATGGANTFTSRDAINWTQQPATTNVGVQGAAFFNNQFVAVGNAGGITTTFDGSAWTDRTSGTAQTLLAVAASPDSAVAVGFAGTILQSAATATAPTVTITASTNFEAVGGNVAFTTTARGSTPLAYQWRKDGVDLPGATADTLFLANVQIAQSGSYTCVVANPVAPAFSAPAALIVSPTLPAADPVDLAFTLGVSLNLAPRTAALQPDGKILIGGAFLLLNEGQAQFGLARLTATGSLDAAFKPGSIDPNGSIQSIVVQPDGKILVGGSFTSINGVARNRVARLNADGSLDPTFVPAYSGTNQVTQLALTSENRVLVVSSSLSLVRLASDGSLDANWIFSPVVVGLNGTTNVFGTVQALDLLPDGRIIIGSSAFVNGTTNSYLQRLNPFGALDPAFPLVTVTSSSAVRALRALGDGRIMAATAGISLGVQRFTAAGGADPSFSPSSISGNFNAVTFTSDGRTWLGGTFTSINGIGRNQLARLTADGAVDSAFNPGTGILNGSNSNVGPNFILPLDDGRAIACGDFNRVNGNIRPLVARLNAQSPGGPNSPAVVALDSYYREVRGGEAFTVRASAAGSGPLTYSGTSPSAGTFSGFTTSAIAFPGIAAGSSGGYSVSATNAGGTSPAQFFYVRVIPSAPFIVAQPPAVQTNSGRSVALSVSAGGSSFLSYQWFKNGTAVANATNSTLNFASATAADSGDYTVVIRNSLGFATSDTVHLGVDETPRFINIATRALAGRADAPLIAGFVVAGPGNKRVMIRAVGPTLSDAFGLAGTLADPVLAVYNSAGALVYTNDDWATTNDIPGIASAGVRLGAFTLTGNSADAACILTLQPGGYTAVVTGKNGATGIALVEVYEDDNNSARLTNLSSRAYVGTGGSVAIPGIVVRGGSAAKKLLVRAVGPGLTAFGVPSVLADPILTITDSTGTVVATNDNWQTAANLADLTAATARVTFPLAAGSKDAALFVTLPPGGYTVQVSGVANATGNALVEVYELP